MDRGVKIPIAATIVLGGITLAMLLGQDRAGIGERPPAPVAHLLLRDPRGPAAGVPRAPDSRPEPAATLPASAQPAPDAPEAASRRGRSVPSWLAVPQLQDRPIRHRVVDGDSLAALAKRYLGSAERQWEIFQANRDVLASPGLLPIGAELKIPPQSAMLQDESSPCDDSTR